MINKTLEEEQLKHLKEKTIYDEDGREELVENDEISNEEAGFMFGFSRELEL